MVQESRQREHLSPAARPLLLAVRFYQAVLGPFMGGQCRFAPTCSEYAISALETHGAFRGSWLTMRRLLRCHPLGGAGYDPVPEKGAGHLYDRHSQDH